MAIEFFNSEDIYSFESENIKIEFSDPNIQAHDEYGYAKNEKNILYYYYTVNGFIKDNNRWKNIFTINTFDFPNLIHFKEMIETLLKNKINIDDYQKNNIKDFGTMYTYNMDTGSLSDDSYSITHSFIKENNNRRKKEMFDVVIGKPIVSLGQDRIELSFNNLNKKDLKTIFQCIEGFITYTISKNNEKIIQMNEDLLASWKIENKKLYSMSKNKSVESVFLPGDKIDCAIMLVGNINSTDFYSNEINDFIIDDITETSIILSSGHTRGPKNEYIKITAPQEIKISTLLELFNNAYHKLDYNETEITADFISTLSEIEKEEFKIETVEFLYEKWKEAIINRTWMCREEHKLPKRASNKGNHENVYASVKVIIKNIKEQLEFGQKSS